MPASWRRERRNRERTFRHRVPWAEDHPRRTGAAARRRYPTLRRRARGRGARRGVLNGGAAGAEAAAERPGPRPAGTQGVGQADRRPEGREPDGGCRIEDAWPGRVRVEGRPDQDGGPAGSQAQLIMSLGRDPIAWQQERPIMSEATDVRSSGQTGEWGEWTTIPTTSRQTDGFTIAVWSDSQSVVTVDVGIGASGNEVSRGENAVPPRSFRERHQGRAKIVRVHEPIPVGTRIAVRLKSPQSNDVVRVVAELWPTRG